MTGHFEPIMAHQLHDSIVLMKGFSEMTIRPALKIVPILVIAAFAPMTVRTVDAGGAATLGAMVPASQRVSMDLISAKTWDALLRRYVDVEGNVDYSAWLNTPSDIRALDTFLTHLSTADPNLHASTAAKISFWINAYNAVTIRGILSEYPTTSIRNHTARLFGYNIWDDLLLTVGGKPFSLNQMEHEVLRKMGEPRIHFAIVCASRSCPRLLNEAYTAEKLETQLNANTRNFFLSSRNFRFDQTAGSFQLSSILKWFGEDFGVEQRSRLKKIARYLPTEEARIAANANSVSISYLEYDWGLNDRATGPSAR